MDYLKIVNETIDSRLAQGNDNSFYILDIEDVKRKYHAWVNNIPRVVPYFAIKCNDHQAVLNLLKNLGAGFDCASKKEIEKILKLNVPPERIIYSHTVKQISHLKYAAENKVLKVTFDCENELYKIKKYHENAQVILRIKFDSKCSVVPFGLKFGCDRFLEAPKLIKLCKELNINLIGVSFHVGSGTESGETYGKAIEAVYELFQVAKQFDFALNFVDIGGGFVGDDVNKIQSYAKPINAAIEKFFNDSTIKIISEPGRYFVESAFIRAIQITLKKILPDGKMHYYVNDGIYTSFLLNHICHGKYFRFGQIEIIRKSSLNNDHKQQLINSTIFGATCDSNDKILNDVKLPELEIGDWLVFKNMGAYTLSLSTSFNNFTIEPEDVIIV
jgi:ornithine decarboxylase